MKPISTTDLAHVTGGLTATSSTNDQLLTAVQGIQSSISSLTQNNNNGLFSGTSGLMFAAALAMSRRNNTTVYGPGYYYQSW